MYVGRAHAADGWTGLRSPRPCPTCSGTQGEREGRAVPAATAAATATTGSEIIDFISVTGIVGHVIGFIIGGVGGISCRSGCWGLIFGPSDRLVLIFDPSDRSVFGGPFVDGPDRNTSDQAARGSPRAEAGGRQSG